ncbi:MAG TPA: hypothetical protein VLT89_02695 [Usitatibacter sp.]|nr:hypothetical protein [Usitatibacter sp.]
MEKLTFTRAPALIQEISKDVSPNEDSNGLRSLTDQELRLAGGGDGVPVWGH